MRKVLSVNKQDRIVVFAGPGRSSVPPAYQKMAHNMRNILHAVQFAPASFAKLEIEMASGRPARPTEKCWCQELDDYICADCQVKIDKACGFDEVAELSKEIKQLEEKFGAVKNER